MTFSSISTKPRVLMLASSESAASIQVVDFDQANPGPVILALHNRGVKARIKSGEDG